MASKAAATNESNGAEEPAPKEDDVSLGAERQLPEAKPVVWPSHRELIKSLPPGLRKPTMVPIKRKKGKGSKKKPVQGWRSARSVQPLLRGPDAVSRLAWLRRQLACSMLSPWASRCVCGRQMPFHRWPGGGAK